MTNLLRDILSRYQQDNEEPVVPYAPKDNDMYGFSSPPIPYDPNIAPEVQAEINAPRGGERTTPLVIEGKAPVTSASPVQSEPQIIQNPPSSEIALLQNPEFVQHLINQQNQKQVQEASIADQINQANDDKRQNMMIAGLGESFDKIGRSIAGYGIPGVKTEAADFSGMKEAGKARVEDTLSAIKARAMDADRTKQKELYDPKSQISQFTRTLAKTIVPGLPENVSAGALKDAGLDIDKMYNAYQMNLERKANAQDRLSILASSLGLRKQGQQNQEDQFKMNKIQAYQTQVNKDKKVQAAEERLDAMTTINDVINDAVNKGGQALSAIGPLQAKALGERGVLTDKDVTRYVQNPQIVSGVMGTYKRWTEGKLRPEDAQNLQRLNGIMMQEAVKQRSDVYNKAIKQGSKNLNISEDEMRSYMDPMGYSTEKMQAPETRQIVDPQFEAKVNNAINATGKSREEVLAILNKHGAQ